MNENKFKILAIDGGGIRGIMPATLLLEISKKIDNPLYKYFDLICGTSTGAVIALAASINKPMDEIVNLYENNAKEIFPKATSTSILGKFLFAHKICHGNGEIYNTSKLESLLQEEFSNKGEYLKMKDALTRVCVPAIDVTGGRVVVYKTPHLVYKPEKKYFKDDEDKCMWEVARASSAAPVFFKPAKIKNSFCIDGGMWANNPSLVAVVEAIRYGYDPKNIEILSLGTGSTVYQVIQGKATKMNLQNWSYGLKLVEMSFEVQSEAVHNQLKCILPKENYLRLDHSFRPSISLSDTSRLSDLKAAAQNIFRDEWSHIEDKFFKKICEKNYMEEKDEV